MLPPDTEDKVTSAPPETSVILWRGTVFGTGFDVRLYDTAGGVEASQIVMETTRAPTEEEAIGQVGGSSAKNINPDKFPEYTTSQRHARQYAAGMIICIKIKRKFLTKGSVSEFGWVALHTAPVEFLDYELYGIAKPQLVNPNTGKRIIAD